jgi:hypothetical protein
MYGVIIPDLSTRWRVSGQLHALAALPPGKSSLIPIWGEGRADLDAVYSQLQM